jgi:glycosyltransferase involved in cell wall biosynthesis
MKIAILSLRSRFGDVTGDCVQAEKTADALRAIGQDADRYYLDVLSGKIYDRKNELLGDWQDVMGGMDVIHTIPPIPIAHIRRQPKVKAKLATSTVFWSSPTYWKVVLENGAKFSVALLKALLREFAAKLGVRLLKAKNGYNVLFANSEDEIRCVKKYCSLKAGAKLFAVPNAIDPIPEWVDELSRFDELPKEDYVLVPGFFAERKNQKTLIRALKDFCHPVVFMGKGPLLEECKKMATFDMLFLGHVDHQSELFYSAMKYARVVCLPSNCETPGIAGLEAAALGARPVVPYEGGTSQYYSWDAEYIDPLSVNSMRNAIERAWSRGRLTADESSRYRRITWEECARRTVEAYCII